MMQRALFSVIALFNMGQRAGHGWWHLLIGPALGSSMFFLAGAVSGAPQEQGEPSAEDKELQEFYKPADWSLLLPFSSAAEKPRRIIKVRIVFDKMAAMPFLPWTRRDKKFEFETKNPETLNLMERFLTTPLRVAIPDDEPFNWVSISYCVGQIEVTTIREKFLVGITTTGFALETKVSTSKNTFLTWGLAQVIDDILFQETKKRMPQVLFRGLSGENMIPGEKRDYKRIKAQHRKQKGMRDASK